MFLSFLDLIEAKDKECYDEIFDEYKTFIRQHNIHWTDKKIRERLEYVLEHAHEFKADFVYGITNDDLILDNLHEFTEFFSKNVDRLI